MSFDPGLPDDRVNVSDSNPLAEAGLLIGGLVAIVVAVAVGSAVLVDWIVSQLPANLEVSVFGGGWVPGTGGDDTGEEGEADVRQVALQDLVDRLALRWEDSPYTFRALVWDQDVPNAFALPGGWIGVTTGLLEAVESENELAFVLGHELGHFHNRDHLRGLGRGLAFSLVLVAVGVAGGGGAVQLASTAGQFAQRGFDREQETRADRFGLELIAAEYGHTAGASDLFDHMPDPDALLDERLEAYLSTHPLSAERLEELARYADESGYSREGRLLALPESVAEPEAEPPAADDA